MSSYIFNDKIKNVQFIIKIFYNYDKIKIKNWYQDKKDKKLV